jgi:hypothetical protein
MQFVLIGPVCPWSLCQGGAPGRGFLAALRHRWCFSTPRAEHLQELGPMSAFQHYTRAVQPELARSSPHAEKTRASPRPRPWGPE